MCVIRGDHLTRMYYVIDDSWDAILTDDIMVMIPYMIPPVHVALFMWLRDDFICTHNSRITTYYAVFIPTLTQIRGHT